MNEDRHAVSLSGHALICDGSQVQPVRVCGGNRERIHAPGCGIVPQAQFRPVHAARSGLSNGAAAAADLDVLHVLDRNGELPVGGPLPPAKVCVVLGSNALVQIMPGGACQPGSWTKTPSGADALVTYSPEFILRFSEGSEGQKECKRKMWASLKSALSRAGLLTPTTGKTP